MKSISGFGTRFVLGESALPKLELKL